MRYSWLFILPLLAIVGIVIYSVYRSYMKKRIGKKVAVVAHSKKIRALPEYERARTHYRILLFFMIISFTVALSSITLSASRPISVEVIEPDYETRDIMICIDTSPSMNNRRENVISYLSEVVSELKGQRLGVTIFASKSAMLSPLTNDYEALQWTLDSLRASFSTYRNRRISYYEKIVGSTSNIGAGVLSCINNFDQLQNAGHSQAVIIATDNEQNEGEIDLGQVANYAKRYGITLYGVDTALVASSGATEMAATKAFRRAVAGTGGVYYSIQSSDLTASDVVDEILKQEAIRHDSERQYVQTDSPAISATIAAVSILIFMLLVWRIHL